MRTMTPMILLMIAIPIVSQALVWDFSDAAQTADWTVVSGACEADEGAYMISNAAAEALTIVGEPNWTDYTITCKARLTEPGGFNNVSIVFRASQDGNDEYMFMLEGGRQQAEWWKKVAGTYTELRVDPLEIDIENWFTFMVAVEGSTFQGYYEDEFISEMEDSDLKEGAVGARVYGCTSHIDDFDVNGPGIPPTGVEAIGKLTATWGSLKKR